MSDGDAALADFAARLRSLKTLPEDVARQAAPLIEEVVKENAAAGVTPDGKPWPTKKDGTRALPNAASAVTAKAVGALVVVKLVGAYVFHQLFKADDRRREILPEGGAGVPPRIAEKLREASRRAFTRAMDQ